MPQERPKKWQKKKTKKKKKKVRVKRGAACFEGPFRPPAEEDSFSRRGLTFPPARTSVESPWVGESMDFGGRWASSSPPSWNLCTWPRGGFPFPPVSPSVTRERYHLLSGATVTVSSGRAVNSCPLSHPTPGLCLTRPTLPLDPLVQLLLSEQLLLA